MSELTLAKLHSSLAEIAKPMVVAFLFAECFLWYFYPVSIALSTQNCLMPYVPREATLFLTFSLLIGWSLAIAFPWRPLHDLHMARGRAATPAEEHADDYQTWRFTFFAFCLSTIGWMLLNAFLPRSIKPWQQHPMAVNVFNFVLLFVLGFATARFLWLEFFRKYYLSQKPIEVPQPPKAA